MTIEEYKQKFLELYNQLEKEHGSVKTVRIGKIHLEGNEWLTRTEISIEF